MANSLMILAVLFVAVLGLFLFPIVKSKNHFDEKGEAIKVYREEVAHIERQHEKGFLEDKEKKQLLGELDKKSAIAITAIEKKTYAYRFSLIPYAVIVACLILAAGTYYHYYQVSGVKHWQDFKEKYHDKITEGLFDAKLMNNVLSNADLQTASNYCFAMQQVLLKNYDTNPDTLANLAQCHLSTGYSQLTVDALKRGLKKAPHHNDLNYLTAALSYAKTQRLSAKDIQRLSNVIKSDPRHAKSIRLLAINSLNQGSYQHAWFFFSKLRELLPNDPELIAALDSLDKTLISQANAQSPEHMAKTVDDRITMNNNASPPKNANQTQLNLSIALDPIIAKSLSGAQVLFIIVKSPKGQLLNATKHLLSDFSKPFNIIISDNQAGAMQRQAMAGHQAFNVIARISLSGSPMASAGDLTSGVTPIRLPQQQVAQLIINQKTP